MRNKRRAERHLYFSPLFSLSTPMLGHKSSAQENHTLKVRGSTAAKPPCKLWETDPFWGLTGLLLPASLPPSPDSTVHRHTKDPVCLCPSLEMEQRWSCAMEKLQQVAELGKQGLQAPALETPQGKNIRLIFGRQHLGKDSDNGERWFRQSKSISSSQDLCSCLLFS